MTLQEADKRSDMDMRRHFVEAFNLLAPHMNPDGGWKSQANEYLALNLMATKFPDITGMRLFAYICAAASIKASGRTPTVSRSIPLDR